MRGKREQSKSTRAKEPDEREEKMSTERPTSVSFYLIDLWLECFASAEMGNWESGRRRIEQRSAAIS